jgi:hypothetical protein
MTRRNQLRLIFHGALILVISMTVEAPGLLYAFHHNTDDLVRFYLRQAHSVLMGTGIWIIATGMALSLLELTARGISWLVWSLVISAYAFLVAVSEFIAGLWYYNLDSKHFPDQISQLRAMSPYLQWTNISFLALSGVTSLLAGSLIVWGAFMAMRHSPIDDIH